MRGYENVLNAAAAVLQNVVDDVQRSRHLLHIFRTLHMLRWWACRSTSTTRPRCAHDSGTLQLPAGLVPNRIGRPNARPLAWAESFQDRHQRHPTGTPQTGLGTRVAVCPAVRVLSTYRARALVRSASTSTMSTGKRRNTENSRCAFFLAGNVECETGASC